MRHVVMVTTALTVLLAGCGGSKMSGFENGEDLPIAHPRDIATKVNSFVVSIEKNMDVGKPLARRSGEVDPKLCGREADKRHVKGWDDPVANSNRNSWYVSFSPYSIGVISYVDISPSADVRAAIARLRDRLSKSGWHIVGFQQPSGGRWTLKAEAPEKGYGGIVEGPVADGHRITVTFSSPCFRHPDALP